MSGIHLYESKHQESYELRIHHHPNYQLLYAIEGEGSIILNGGKHPLEQDNAVLILPYAEHAVSSDSNLTLLVLAFDAESFQTPVHLEADPPLFTQSELLRLSTFSANELRLLLRKSAVRAGTEGCAQRSCHADLRSRDSASPRPSEGTTQAADANSLRAERIRNYIDLHYYESLTAEDLAYKLGVGVRHANNIFKESYGMTPVQYLTESRIRVAKKLLIETDKDIVSICFEVGYESLPTFYRAFKNTVGLSPNKFRQQHRE
ncbi:AraC family transcriptional regulator [Paenibacillus sp. P25]|nr:AraC family transcriptional regulator [Paenibacillus sp. P25]